MTDDNSQKQKGQAAAEYGLIIALIGILVIIILAILGVRLSSVYCGIVGLIGQTPSQCAKGTLLQDPFDNLSGWNFSTGNGWVNQDGKMCAAQSGERRAYTGQSDWSDYTVQAQQATLNSGDGYGVYFRVTNEPAINGYVFQYDPGYRGGPYPNGAFLIRKVTNGNETPPLAVSAAPADFQWNNTTRNVSVDVRGSTFTANLDGKQILQAKDSQYSTGRVGLRAWDSSNACFDNFSVSR
jgi:Flp pilus assembly pilin Flp